MAAGETDINLCVGSCHTVRGSGKLTLQWDKNIDASGLGLLGLEHKLFVRLSGPHGLQPSASVPGPEEAHHECGGGPVERSAGMAVHKQL